MFITHLQVEPRSGNPSLLQTVVDACTTALDMLNFAFGIFNPISYTALLVNLNRTVARAYCMG